MNFGVFRDKLQDEQETDEAACSTDAGGNFLPVIYEVKISGKILL